MKNYIIVLLIACFCTLTGCFSYLNVDPVEKDLTYFRLGDQEITGFVFESAFDDTLKKINVKIEKQSANATKELIKALEEIEIPYGDEAESILNILFMEKPKLKTTLKNIKE